MPQISFLTIQVHDMDVALQFYVDILGFSVRMKEDYPHYVLLDHDPFPIAIHAPGERNTAEYDKHANTVIGIGVIDIVSKLADLKARGVDLIHDAPKRFKFGLYAALRDPSGNIIELIEFKQK
ncbi:MAG: VOC family protein [Anaerolineae bacterium]|nr:VOC family protein [Anaerolineae bacterium]